MIANDNCNDNENDSEDDNVNSTVIVPAVMATVVAGTTNVIVTITLIAFSYCHQSEILQLGRGQPK